MAMNKKSKRGAVEVQFNWIFVLIIGAVILVFFFSMIMKQKTISEQKTADEVLSQIELKISGAKVSTRTADSIPIPKMDFQFKCDIDSCTDYACTSFYSVKNQKLQGRSYSISPVFAPDLVKGTSMTTWTLDWNVPYRVTNFVYVSSPLVRYIVVKDSSNPTGDNAKLAQAIYDAIPTQKIDGVEVLFNKELVAVSGVGGVVSKGNYKVRFIFVGASGEITLASSFKDIEVSAININPGGTGKNIDGFGKITFYKLNKNTLKLEPELLEANYISKASLFGAVFSENKEIYECNMKKAFNSLRIVSGTYEVRTDSIYNYYNPDKRSLCTYFQLYPQAKTFLASMGGYSILDASNIYSASKSLQNINNNLVKQSCMTVY